VARSFASFPAEQVREMHARCCQCHAAISHEGIEAWRAVAPGGRACGLGGGAEGFVKMHGGYAAYHAVTEHS